MSDPIPGDPAPADRPGSGPPEPRPSEASPAARRLELLDRKEALESRLRRTRLTVPAWLAAVAWFLFMGLAWGNVLAASVMGGFSALAAGVMHAARRRQRAELRRVEAELARLPWTGPGADAAVDRGEDDRNGTPGEA